MIEKLFAIFRGRLSRRSYVLFWFLPTLAITLLFEVIPRQDGMTEEAIVWAATIAGVLVMAGDIPFGMARFRNGGLSGWWYILLGWPQLLRLVLGLAFGFALNIGFHAARLLLGQDSGSPTNWFASLPQSVGMYLPLLLGALLLMGWWWTVYRPVIRAGDAGPNKFGPDPLRADVLS